MKRRISLLWKEPGQELPWLSIICIAVTSFMLAHQVLHAQLTLNSETIDEIDRSRNNGFSAPRQRLSSRKLLGTLRFRHGDTITSICFSPSGETLATGSWDKTVRLWEVPSGKQIRRFGREREPVYSVAFSPDGKKLAAGSNEITLWEVETGKEIWRTPAFSDCFDSLVFSPDGKILARGGAERTIVLLDVQHGTTIGKCRGHAGRVSAIAFSPNGESLVSGSNDKTVRVWDTKTTKLLRKFEVRGNVLSLAICAGGKTLACASGELGFDESPGQICLLSFPEGKALGRLIKPFGPVLSLDLPQEAKCLTFSTDGGTLAAAFRNMIWLWDSRSQKALKKIECAEEINAMAFSPNGKALAYAGFGQTVHCVDRLTFKELGPTIGHQGKVTSVAFSPDGKQIISGSSDKTMRVWQVDRGIVLRRFPEALGPVNAIAISPDGGILASASDSTCLWDLRAYNKLHQFSEPQPTINSLAFSSDGRLLASGGLLGVISIWDLGSLRLKQRLGPSSRNLVSSVSFSPDARILATADYSFLQFPISAGTIRLWDIQTGKAVRSWKAHPEGISRVVFSPDGKSLASTGAQLAREPQRLMFWDAESAKAQQGLIDDVMGVMSFAFSADGKSIATGHCDHRVRIWELCTGRQRCELQGHQGAVTSLAFSDDGKKLVSGSMDTTILVWDLEKETLRSSAKTSRAAEVNLQHLWEALATPDSREAYRVMWVLTKAQKPAVSLIKASLRPTVLPDYRRLTQLIVKLDSQSFSQREEASKALEQESAEPFLNQALSEKISTEARRRSEEIIEKIKHSPQRLQANRAIEILELIGSEEARDLLVSLSEGVQGAWLTKEAKSSLDRLQRRGCAKTKVEP